jgi:type II secretory pathway component PulK
MTSLDELLLIRGFDEGSVARLRPYATAIPRRGARGARAAPPVNALTAKPLVLAALGCEGADTLPACPMRFNDEDDDKSREWKAEFDAWRQDNCAEVPANLLTTKSDVFSLLASGSVGDVSQTLRVLVRRTGSRVTRLWWQERPLSEVLPVEVR